ncbi:hypothetical protein HN51_065470 [Arachis hypogaea]|uniref:uncharacterized protein LOC107637606 isoform X1 n=1 Tax=Arachis ipaensis TaxID=130454 RepID=UPI000A2B4490|nr:uncharacterized protein LOC107637606 isoform X1 [Arachis ipaensis]XP_025646448.1 protein SINE3 isoform X1 [Arachis hypogaea]QHO06618.1 uncharacterized protein DS421_14g456290 [Arachis hypogaea]QHO06619.1 uncharacterized protein DS421_14g456290 [Arachis hypogaea]
MKDHQLQTPLKLSLSTRSAENHHAKSKVPSSKKSSKITRKNLNAEFTCVSEDSVDSSPISEISYLNHNDDAKTLLEETPSMTLLPTDTTLSEITNDVTGSGSTIDDCELDGFKFNSVEAEIALNFLKKSKVHLLKSSNVAPHYRKLIGEIIEYTIQDLSTKNMPEDTDCFNKVSSEKIRTVFLCFFVWIIVVWFMLFFNSGIPSGVVPT